MRKFVLVVLSFILVLFSWVPSKADSIAEVCDANFYLMEIKVDDVLWLRPTASGYDVRLSSQTITTKTCLGVDDLKDQVCTVVGCYDTVSLGFNYYFVIPNIAAIRCINSSSGTRFFPLNDAALYIDLGSLFCSQAYYDLKNQGW